MMVLRSMAVGLSLSMTVAVAAAAGPDRGDAGWKHHAHYDGHKNGRYDRDHKSRGGHEATRVVFTREVRVVIEDYYRAGKHCPPGLAKKRNGCLPPGHAKKRYHVGKELPRHVRVERLPRYLKQRLPPPPAGYAYGYVDNDVLLIAEATHRVVDAVVAVNAAMNALR